MLSALAFVLPFGLVLQPLASPSIRMWPTLDGSERSAPSTPTKQPCSGGGSCQNCPTCPLRAQAVEGARRAAAPSMTLAAADETAAVAEAVALAAARIAEKYAAHGGNAGDHHGRDGIQPVLEAAVAAATTDVVKEAVTQAASNASARTNANARSVADAIIVAVMAYGANPEIRLCPLTGRTLYNTLQKFTSVPWEADA